MPILQTFRAARWDRVTHSLQRLFRGASGDLDRYDRFAGYALCLVTALTVSLYMSLGLSHAQWSVYADHELRSYLVAYPNLSFTDLPSLLSKTEVGYLGELTRYRPINYLFYASEALAWGNSYFLLNIARVAGLCVFSTFLLFGLYRFFPALVACALGALCLTSPYWKSVWIGFGPNEQYLALLGIPFTWAYVRLYWHALPGNAGMPATWAVCLISAVLLVGTKEPMVVLAPALVVLLALSLYHDRHYDYRLVGCGIAIALMSLIVWAILSGLARQGGADFYGNSVAPTERLAKLLDGGRHYPFPRLLLLGIVTVGLRAVAKKTLPGSLRTIDVATQFQFWLLVLSFSHLVFYDGWPTGNRYEFPGELFVFISFLIPLYMAGQIIRSSRPALWMPFHAGVFVLLVGATLWRGYGGFRNDVAVYVTRSEGFTAAILTAAAQAKSNPAIPVVIESASPYDLEPIFAVNRFLISLGVTNPMFVRPHELAAAVYPKNAFFQGLIDTIDTVSKQGTITKDSAVGTLPGPFLVNYQQFSSFNPTAQCMSVSLGNAPHDGCSLISVVTY